MALVSASTNPGARAGALAKAILSAARSFPPAIDQHQTRRGACSALRPSTPAAVNQLQACELGRGDASPVPFQFRSDARTSRCCIRQRVCLPLPQGHTRAYSVRSPGSRRLCGQSLRDQQLVEFARHAEIIHPTNRLSFAPSLDGFKTIGKDLTIGTKSLPPRGKAND